MYPRVRQYESSELHRYLALKDLERAERAREKPRRRRVRWLALAVLVATVAAVVYATAANAASAAACTSRTTTVAGSPARVFCGPATAAVTFGGKTFRFADGACTTSPGFTVNLGTLVIGSTAKARPYFGLFLTSGRPGTYSGKQAAVSFASRATRVSLAPNSASRVIVDRGLRSGSFSGKDLLGRRLAGSFHC